MESFRKAKNFLFLFVFSTSVSLAADQWMGEICGKFVLVGPREVSFTKNEMVLICGAKEVAEWNNLAESQSLFHLKTFFEERGYFNLVTKKEGTKTVVNFKEKTQVRSWDLKDGGRTERSHFRLIEGEPLTPALLDSVTDRVKLALENASYACPTVKSKASAVQNTLTTEVAPVEKKTVGSVTREPIEGMDPDALRRYDAFTIGGPYHRDNLHLTENRIGADTILQSAHFESVCTGNSVHLTQKSVAGPPRILLFGVGVNTERGPTAKATWKHARLGKNGSSLAFTLTGSFKEQRFDAVSDWYFSDPLNRLHMNPALMAAHQSENTYERYEGQLRLTPATSWDGDATGIRASLGPTLNLERTVSGVGPRNSQFLAFNAFLQWMDHPFELYQASPRRGFEVSLNTMSAFQSVLSAFGATRLELHITKLWNVLEWDPPAVVLGLRVNASSTLTEENLTSTSVLPSNFRHFIGGSKDLRGFDRLSLPSNEGALTALTVSGEARFLGLLPWNLQPLAFVDAGKAGEKSLELNQLIYWSPGVGMRWESPIGAFRTTLARGFVGPGNFPEIEKWFFYLSYGEEF